MRTATEWFEAYGVSHKHPTNKAIHWICIPVITWSLLAVGVGFAFAIFGTERKHIAIIRRLTESENEPD